MEIKDFESFGIIDRNGMLTNAGALFADESPVYCSRLFCTRWNGIDKASGVIDALDDEEYTGSLILLLEEGMNFARRNSKKMWKKESDRRVEYPEYPERSIFEGLVNGLVHRDYLDMGSEVHIDIFDDRLEIYSPGGMYDGTLIQDRDIGNVPSKRRNPVVADIFSRLDYMERRGSGFKKIMQAYEVEPNYTEDKKPVFYSNATEFRVILKNLNFKNEVLNEKNEVLNEVLDLKEFIKDPVRTLSLGQRMRADIAASLLHNPKVLFLDEPTIGLDVSVKDNIRRAITQINQEEETTILLTTHDLSDIEQLCDRIFMIDKGQEIFDGTVSQLKETFGKMKTLSFDLTPGQNHLVSHYEGLPDMSIDRQGNTLNIEFDSSRYQSADIIKQTLSDFEVRDLKMVDTDIEDIIRRFYRKEL